MGCYANRIHQRLHLTDVLIGPPSAGGTAQYLVLNPGEIVDADTLGLARPLEQHRSFQKALQGEQLVEVEAMDSIVPMEVKIIPVDGELLYTEFDDKLDALEEKDEQELEKLKVSSRRRSRRSSRGTV